MTAGLGPAKGKDFATSIGPIVVTPDEFDGTAAEMAARVNGEERSRGNLRDLYHGWEAILARAAQNTVLRPGDVIGSGTVGTGCILELRPENTGGWLKPGDVVEIGSGTVGTGCILEHGDGRWLQRGDVVELEVEGIGVLRNRIV
jgi:fumarylacetoacetate (FAA) hydrolase